VDAQLDYDRSYSLSSVQTGRGTFGIERDLSRRWFGHMEAGYGVVVGLRSTTTYPRYSTYSGGAELGARLEAHTLLIYGHRDLSDTYGLGAANTTSAGLAWNWHRRASAWTLSSSFAYQRLAGRSVQLLQAWMYQGTIARQLTPHTRLLAQAVYATDSGPQVGDFSSLMRRGARLSLVWTPAAQH
jgi:hypothetical protein